MSVKKIALVGYRLNKGGAEKVMATLSNFFYNKGLDVHIIIVLDDVKYSHSGTVVNLGKLKNRYNGIFNKLKRFRFLKNYLKQQKFDFIIDFRFRIKPIQELLISKFVYNTKTIYTIHSSKLNSYMPNFTPLTKLIYANCFSVVSITNSMQNLVKEKHNLKNVSTIYNPINIAQTIHDSNHNININFEYIIGVGQYDTNVKQFDKLIEAYSKSDLPKKSISLIILGTGQLKEYLISVSVKYKVKHLVHLIGFKNNPFKYIRHAKFFVLSSKFEGLPMVVLEALACNTPVVSFDCSTGPKEIVLHGENGLLIEDQNIDALVKGMNTMILDNDLYLKCKNNALKSIEKFSIDSIGQQWLELMNFKN